MRVRDPERRPAHPFEAAEVPIGRGRWQGGNRGTPFRGGRWPSQNPSDALTPSSLNYLPIVSHHFPVPPRGGRQVPGASAASRRELLSSLTALPPHFSSTRLMLAQKAGRRSRTACGAPLRSHSMVSSTTDPGGLSGGSMIAPVSRNSPSVAVVRLLDLMPLARTVSEMVSPGASGGRVWPAICQLRWGFSRRSSTALRRHTRRLAPCFCKP